MSIKNKADSRMVFISHSHKDFDIAHSVCCLLEDNNISCWIAPRDVRPQALTGMKRS